MIYTKKMALSDLVSDHIAIGNGAGEKDVFGLEVELEGENIIYPPATVLKHWKIEGDGSLRKLTVKAQACEYVLKTPLTYFELNSAVSSLFNFLMFTPDTVVYDSYRTSIHVHVNYCQETLRTVYNSMVISIILDELLTSQNGDHRIGNNFCLRTRDALGQIVSISNSIKNGNEFFAIEPNHRYSSINFASLTKFGSIEYRSLECSTHYGRLTHWVGTLQAIKQAARQFDRPDQVIERFSGSGPRAFLNIVLGAYANKYLAVEDCEEMLYNGVRLAQDIAYCAAWNTK